MGQAQYPLYDETKSGPISGGLTISNVKKRELTEDSLALPSHVNQFDADGSAFEEDVRNLHSDENPEDSLSASLKSQGNPNARILHSSENSEEDSVPTSSQNEENSNARILHSDEDSEEASLSSSLKSEENSCPAPLY